MQQQMQQSGGMDCGPSFFSGCSSSSCCCHHYMITSATSTMVGSTIVSCTTLLLLVVVVVVAVVVVQSSLDMESLGAPPGRRHRQAVPQPGELALLGVLLGAARRLGCTSPGSSNATTCNGQAVEGIIDGPVTTSIVVVQTVAMMVFVERRYHRVVRPEVLAGRPAAHFVWILSLQRP